MILNISASYGSGGRVWESVLVSVGSSSKNVSLVQRFVSENDILGTGRLVVPNWMLESGYSYTWEVQLCNFLGTCGRSSVRVGV